MWLKQRNALPWAMVKLTTVEVAGRTLQPLQKYFVSIFRQRRWNRQEALAGPAQSDPTPNFCQIREESLGRRAQRLRRTPEVDFFQLRSRIRKKATRCLGLFKPTSGGTAGSGERDSQLASDEPGVDFEPNPR